MDKLITSDPKPDPVMEKFDKLYGILKRITKAEIDIKKLKTFIRAAEKKTRKYKKDKNLQKERKNSERRSHRSSSDIIISKVYRKNKILRNPPIELVLLKESNCPNWLILLAEGYTAIRECFWEIREEIGIICNRFMKQETYYVRMSSRRYNFSPDRFNRELSKVEEKEHVYFMKRYEKTTRKMGIHTHEIEIRKEKEDKLKNIKRQIMKEIHTITDKFEELYPILSMEISFSEGAEERLNEYLTSASEEKKLSETLAQDITERKKNIEEIRVSKYLSLTGMRENIEDLQASCDLAAEKMMEEENTLSESKDAIHKYKETIKNAISSKEQMSSTLCAKEEEMSALVKTLNTHDVVSPETVYKKKRLQELYHKMYTNWCEQSTEFMEKINSKNQQLKGIGEAIFKVKKNFIVPLKLQINEYRDKFQKTSVQCKVSQETNLMLEEEECRLREELSDLTEFQKTVKNSLTKERTLLKKQQHRMNLRSQSATSIALHDSEFETKECKSTTSLPECPGYDSEHESTYSLIADLCQALSQPYSNELQNIMSKDMAMESLSGTVTANVQRVRKLRRRESELLKAVSYRRLQVDPSQEMTLTISLAYLSIACQLPKRSIHEDSYASLPSRQRSMKRGGGSETSLSPRKREVYIDVTSRELHSQFSKLLFL